VHFFLNLIWKYLSYISIRIQIFFIVILKGCLTYRLCLVILVRSD